jgi:hypothetical protein
MPEKTAEKKQSKPKVTRINKVDESTDEVFVHSETPYVNKAIYVKSGTYKVGDAVEEEG